MGVISSTIQSIHVYFPLVSYHGQIIGNGGSPLILSALHYWSSLCFLFSFSFEVIYGNY